ncbi:F-box domain protein [Ancylostoma caninum]|uniref:F-box domain protein n=1 Tax=Ancylostoma caninum TaxID=29170 RepID=A0A368G8T9_ANCCA|nr:F-box domain protein [Ancylostoma caninum]
MLTAAYSFYSFGLPMGRASANWDNDRKFRRVDKLPRKRERDVEEFQKNDTTMFSHKRSKKSDQGLPLFDLPLYVIEKIVSRLSLSEMATFKRCSRQAKEIVDGYWQLQRSFKTSVEDFHQLFPYIDRQKPQFESLFHIRRELGKYLCMLPKNRLLEVDFSGLRRFHHEMMESILMRNHLDPNMLFSQVTSISFAHCTVSCADLESLSYYTQNLKSLTIPDRLIDHKQEGEDVDPNLIQYYRSYQKNGLIGHRSKMIAHLKTLWPALVQLTFSNKTLILDE